MNAFHQRKLRRIFLKNWKIFQEKLQNYRQYASKNNIITSILLLILIIQFSSCRNYQDYSEYIGKLDKGCSAKIKKIKKNYFFSGDVIIARLGISFVPSSNPQDYDILLLKNKNTIGGLSEYLPMDFKKKANNSPWYVFVNANLTGDLVDGDIFCGHDGYFKSVIIVRKIFNVKEIERQK